MVSGIKTKFIGLMKWSVIDAIFAFFQTGMGWLLRKDSEVLDWKFIEHAYSKLMDWTR